MVLKVHGFLQAASTQRVIIVLKELNVPFELVVVDMTKAEHKSPEYKTKQPWGAVPFLDDDGFQLFESRAICRYVLEKYRPTSSLIPKELHARALFEQAVSIETSYFDTPALTIYYEKVLMSFFGKETDEARYRKALHDIETTFDIYDKILGQQKYLAGNELSLADLFHIPFGKAVYFVTPEAYTKRPNVARWWAELCSRPACLSITDELKSAEYPELRKTWHVVSNN